MTMGKKRHEEEFRLADERYRGEMDTALRFVTFAYKGLIEIKDAENWEVYFAMVDMLDTTARLLWEVADNGILPQNKTRRIREIQELILK